MYNPILASTDATGFSPTFVYEQEYIQGFSVLLHPDVLLRKAQAQQLRDELERQLKAIIRVMPAEPLRELRQVNIWAEWAEQPNGSAMFHPSEVWLKQNNYNPDKARGIEISNTNNFIKWSKHDQPWLLLHELTHAYHYQVMGENNPDIKAAYRQAMLKGLYDSVPHFNGGSRRAYALTDEREYFAELSEAYFGRNDHYPFRRTDLMKHDPVGYQLMVMSWGWPR